MLKLAKEEGFLAMQFNIVVSTNTSAVKLWQSLGFKIIGTSPKSFNHKELGLVDSYIMHQHLSFILRNAISYLKRTLLQRSSLKQKS